MSCRVTWRREASCNSRGASSAWSRFIERRRQDKYDEYRATRLVERFAATAANVGLARDTESCAGLPGIASPQVLHVAFFDEVETLTVRMLPGQLVREYQDRAAQLAEGLGVASVSFRWRSHGIAIAE